MIESKIEGLFPTPIYIAQFDRDFNEKEIQFVRDQQQKCHTNIGNVHTKDSYVLNNPAFKNIKSFLEQCCADYLKKIICPKNDISLYITQSWINYTKQNQFHHMHNHPNSIVSGVFYIDCDEETDQIQFSTFDRKQQIKPSILNYNKWNSDTWWLPSKKGKLIMFPSSTIHQVNPKTSSGLRVSLSFNTFYSGKLAEDKDLSQLVLN